MHRWQIGASYPQALSPDETQTDCYHSLLRAKPRITSSSASCLSRDPLVLCSEPSHRTRRTAS
uniref:Uncharacterized protein n=1 Tax=Zea mays TaxID=4577 RepID=C0PCB1_MAIZE|nr:unknown [Zea mays]